MIDFRTHVISIIAIFFALAVGIALGAGPLKGNIDEQLNARVDELGAENQRLRDEVAALETQDERRTAFVEQVEPTLVAGQLAGESVLVLQLPGTDDDTIDGVTAALDLADARVTGVVSVTDAWLDPDQETVLDTLASQLVSPGVTLPEGSAYDRAATVLATALLTTEDPEPTDASADAQTTMAALTEAGLVTGPEPPPPPARLALLIAGPAEPEDDAAPLTALAAAADRAGTGTVVTGPASSAVEGGVIAAIRDDSGLAAEISTVDGVDAPTALVASIWALAEQSAGGAGQYGSIGDTDGPLPPPPGVSAGSATPAA